MGGNPVLAARGRGGGISPAAKRIFAAAAGAALLSVPASHVFAKPPGSTSGSDGTTSDSKGAPGHSTGGGGTVGGNTTITVTKDQDLRFGKLVMTATSGIVVVPALGLPTYQGAVSIDTGSGVGPARFEIKGPPGGKLQLNLTFPLSGAYGGSGTAKLDSLSVAADFMPGFNQNGTLVQLKLDGSGSNAITVGGKLTFARPDQYGAMNILFPISASVVQ